MKPKHAIAAWLILFFAVLIWSAVRPYDYVIWALESMPALLAFALLVITRRSFPLTPLAYGLILLHSIILMIGAHYTYAQVPLFDSMKDWFGWERNNYDKLGHFAQGFVPAIIAREILIRNMVVQGRGWLFFIIVCVCLAISASYELIEWGVALWSESSAQAFLGTQGYIWDTQSDMLYAGLGAILALLLLSSIHDRELAALSGTREWQVLP